MEGLRFLFLIRASLACALIISAQQANGALLFNYPNFSSTAGLTLVGNATTASTTDGTVLRVTGANFNESGAAYSTSPVALGSNATFSTQFQFRFTSPGGIDPADGITFVLAASANGLGTGGGGIGYLGVPNSIALEFDTYNNGGADGNSSNHVGVDTGASLNDTHLTNVYGNGSCGFVTGSPSQNPNTAPGCMSNGNVWTVNISYDGSNLTATLKDSAEASIFTALGSVPINIASLLGTNTAFVGFTSGTGGGFENHDILNWQFANTSTLVGVPEPASLLLIGTGLLAIGAYKRVTSRL